MNLVELKWEIDRVDSRLEHTVDHIIKMENELQKLTEEFTEFKYKMLDYIRKRSNE
jgi:hypothetical protein